MRNFFLLVFLKPIINIIVRYMYYVYIYVFNVVYLDVRRKKGIVLLFYKKLETIYRFYYIIDESLKYIVYYECLSKLMLHYGMV